MASFRARGGRVCGDLDDLGGAGAGGQTPGGRRLELEHVGDDSDMVAKEDHAADGRPG
jgi:hypothetical protein